MTKMALVDRDLDEIEYSEEQNKVINFKLDWLRHAGYSVKNAERIATDPGIDWHFAVKLRKQCPDEALCMRVMFGS